MNENKEAMAQEDEELGIITLVDEDGKEVQFEIIGQQQMDGNTYVALLPADTDIESDEWEYVVVKYVEDEEGGSLVSVDDDAEYEKIADIFDKFFSEEIDYDA